MLLLAKVINTSYQTYSRISQLEYNNHQRVVLIGQGRFGKCDLVVIDSMT